MRFLDANVFVYAFYRPHRQLGEKERTMKESARDILTRVNEEERVITTVVHLSEVSNILKRGMSPRDLTNLMLGLFMRKNIVIEGVSRDLYFSATDLGEELELDPNDALAIEVMRRNAISEIYSFDTGFDRIHEITRLPAL